MTKHLVEIGPDRFLAVAGPYAGWIYNRVNRKEVVRAYKPKTVTLYEIRPFEGLNRLKLKKARAAA